MATKFAKELIASPGKKIRLDKWDPVDTLGWEKNHKMKASLAQTIEKLDNLQYLLYAEHSRALLIVLQGLDAAGKDGTIRHVMSGVNPRGCRVSSFKKPTSEELAHDFLWRVHPHAPGKGTIAIFNRSHYEDVLVVRVHKLAPKEVWSARYQFINDFEKLLRRGNNTRILKFFLHISREEQLERFKQRLDDPARNWKISRSDYQEREYWDAYTEAYEEVFARTSKQHAPWYVIPSNHKWFRNLAVSQIVAATMEDLGMHMPGPQVDLNEIRKEYHEAADQERRHQSKTKA